MRNRKIIVLISELGNLNESKCSGFDPWTGFGEYELQGESKEFFALGSRQPKPKKYRDKEISKLNSEDILGVSLDGALIFVEYYDDNDICGYIEGELPDKEQDEEFEPKIITNQVQGWFNFGIRDIYEVLQESWGSLSKSKRWDEVCQGKFDYLREMDNTSFNPPKHSDIEKSESIENKAFDIQLRGEPKEIVNDDPENYWEMLRDIVKQPESKSKDKCGSKWRTSNGNNFVGKIKKKNQTVVLDEHQGHNVNQEKRPGTKGD